jgi:hypothetical protein
MDVAEIEVRLEAVRLERDGALVEGLGFNQLVASVMNIREIHERGHEVWIDDQRLPVRRRRLLDFPLVTIVKP